MNDELLHAIYNYRRLSPTLATSGQPTEEQLADVARCGFRVVVNLLPPDNRHALADERAAVESLGMAYENIPVIWEQPTHADLEAFFRAMAKYAGEPVLVHCAANMRVSVFMMLYRVLVLDWRVEDAMKDVYAIWKPNETWQAFVDAELSK